MAWVERKGGTQTRYLVPYPEKDPGVVTGNVGNGNASNVDDIDVELATGNTSEARLVKN